MRFSDGCFPLPIEVLHFRFDFPLSDRRFRFSIELLLCGSNHSLAGRTFHFPAELLFSRFKFYFYSRTITLPVKYAGQSPNLSRELAEMNCLQFPSDSSRRKIRLNGRTLHSMAELPFSGLNFSLQGFKSSGRPRQWFSLTAIRVRRDPEPVHWNTGRVAGHSKPNG